MEPAVAQFEREYVGKLTCVDVNVAEQHSPEFLKYIGYKKTPPIPDTIVIRNDRVIAGQTGPLTLPQLEQLADTALQ